MWIRYNVNNYELEQITDEHEIIADGKQTIESYALFMLIKA